MRLLSSFATRQRWLWLIVLSSLLLVAAKLCGIETVFAGRDEQVSSNAYATEQSVQDNTAAPFLKPDETIKRECVGGQTFVYRLAVGPGQYAHVIVEQQGIDLKLKLSDPQRQLIMESDNPNGKYGPEFVSTIAEAAGDYVLEVSSTNKWSPPGSYEIKFEQPREPTSADKDRARAERLLAEGPALVSRGGEHLDKALELYTQALPLWQSLESRLGEAYTRANLGSLYRRKGKDFLQNALDNFEQARLLLSRIGDAPGQAYVLNERGAAQRDLGDPMKSLPDYEQALKLRQGAGDKWGQAQILNNIGLIYSRGARQQTQAVGYYEQALSLWREARDAYQEANTLNNLAGALDELGQSQTALDYYTQAQRIWQGLDISNKDIASKLVVAHNNIGKIYDTWGEADEARKHYSDALSLAKENPNGTAQTLENFGMYYADLGDGQSALKMFEESLRLRKDILKTPRGIAVSLNNMGYAYNVLGDYTQALENYKQALKLYTETNEKHGRAYTLIVMGAAYYKLGDFQSALECYRQASEIEATLLSASKQLQDPRTQALVFTKLGQTYTALGRLPEAAESYRQALPLWEKVAERRGEAQTFYGLAVVARASNNLDDAREKIEKAVDIVESLRTRVTSQQLRISYLARQQDYYELGVDVRMQLYRRTGAEEHLAAALLANEKSRARSLLDTLAEARVQIYRDASAALLEEKRSLERQINDNTEKLVVLRGKNLKADADAVEVNLNKLAARYDAVQAEIKKQNPASAALAQGRPLSLKEIQQSLDDDSVMLEYALGDERSYVWAVTRRSATAAELPGRAEIEKLANSVRDMLTETDYRKRLAQAQSQYWQSASALSDKIVGPVAAQLGTRKLLVIPDGVLHFIPFAALPVPVMQGKDGALALYGHGRDDNGPVTLGNKHEIVYEQSASVITLLRELPRKVAPKEVIVLADPVFDSRDRRVQLSGKPGNAEIAKPARSEVVDRLLKDVGEVGDQLPRLRSLDEAKEIVAMAAPGKATMLVGFKANRSTATSDELSHYRIVHFATHSVLNDSHPEFSGIVLSLVDEQGRSQNGFLRLQDIYNLSLPVDMVVLSACRTGVGKEVRGEGIISLTRGFMSAGTSRVVASLWKVDDDATADLMKRFYRKILKEGVSPPAALKAAQEEVRAQKLWRSPYYWAGFVLQGEWR